MCVRSGFSIVIAWDRHDLVGGVAFGSVNSTSVTGCVLGGGGHDRELGEDVWKGRSLTGPRPMDVGGSEEVNPGHGQTACRTRFAGVRLRLRYGPKLRRRSGEPRPSWGEWFFSRRDWLVRMR